MFDFLKEAYLKPWILTGISLAGIVAFLLYVSYLRNASEWLALDEGKVAPDIPSVVLVACAAAVSAAMLLIMMLAQRYVVEPINKKADRIRVLKQLRGLKGQEKEMMADAIFSSSQYVPAEVGCPVAGRLVDKGLLVRTTRVNEAITGEWSYGIPDFVWHHIIHVQPSRKCWLLVWLASLCRCLDLQDVVREYEWVEQPHMPWSGRIDTKYRPVKTRHASAPDMRSYSVVVDYKCICEAQSAKFRTLHACLMHNNECVCGRSKVVNVSGSPEGQKTMHFRDQAVLEGALGAIVFWT